MLAFMIIAAIALVAAAVYLYLVMPSLKRHPDLDKMCRYIAHRGLHGLEADTPENSLAAFLQAAEKGYAIENDIHITRDGHVVVFHDGDTSRMCGEKLKIEDSTLAELKRLRLAGGSQQIPTLEECLAAVDGRVPLLIEFKCDYKTYEPLCRAANKLLSQYDGIYFVQSFFPPAMGWYRKNRPDVCRGQLSEHFSVGQNKARYFLLSNLMLNYMSRPHFVSFKHGDADYLPRRINTLLGAYPIGWTFRKAEDLKESKDKFNNYIFEGFEPKE